MRVSFSDAMETIEIMAVFYQFYSSFPEVLLGHIWEIDIGKCQSRKVVDIKGENFPGSKWKLEMRSRHPYLGSWLLLRRVVVGLGPWLLRSPEPVHLLFHNFLAS